MRLQSEAAFVKPLTHFIYAPTLYENVYGRDLIHDAAARALSECVAALFHSSFLVYFFSRRP